MTVCLNTSVAVQFEIRNKKSASPIFMVGQNMANDCLSAIPVNTSEMFDIHWLAKEFDRY